MWDGSNFTDRFRPAPEMMLGDASVVMLSKQATDGGAVSAYGDFVHRNYRLVQESRCWWMYRLK
jgi:hypothetical protein